MQILYTAKMIHYLTGQHILHQSIHGKIPAKSRLVRSQIWIHIHREILMAPAGGLFFSWHGNIQSIAAKAVDAKACAHLRAFSQAIQDLSQFLRGNAVDLNIYILIFHPHQFVPHAAADEIRTAAGLLHAKGDLMGHL